VLGRGLFSGDKKKKKSQRKDSPLALAAGQRREGGISLQVGGKLSHHVSAKGRVKNDLKSVSGRGQAERERNKKTANRSWYESGVITGPWA